MKPSSYSEQNDFLIEKILDCFGNDDDNYAEHKVEIVYVSYMGWFDSIREQPLIWLFAIMSVLVLLGIGVTANRTAISHNEDSLYDEEWEDDDLEEDEYDDL